jgi:hypothetical protein
MEIPVYISDENRIMCNMGGDCEEGTLLDTLGAGRRFTLGEVVDAIMDHAKDKHSLPITGR